MESHSTDICRKLSGYWKKIHFTVYFQLLHNIAAMQFLQECCRLKLKKNFLLQWKNDDEQGGKN